MVHQTRTTTYTIGHDVIAQFSAALGALVLLTDARGSTRAVADAAAQVQQEYLYDAYLAVMAALVWPRGLVKVGTNGFCAKNYMLLWPGWPSRARNDEAHSCLRFVDIRRAEFRISHGRNEMTFLRLWVKVCAGREVMTWPIAIERSVGADYIAGVLRSCGLAMDPPLAE